MRRMGGLVAALTLVGALGLAGCGTDEQQADDDATPTLSVRPSPSEPSSAASTPSTSATPSASAGATRSSAATSAPPSTSAGGAPDLGKPPTTYAEAEAHVNAVLASESAQQKAVFRTGDDIYCVLSHDVLDPACEAPQGGGTRDPKVCGNAESPSVGRIELAARGAVPLCNTDTIRESMPAPVAAPAVLTHSATGVQCAVESIGVTCIDAATAAGFFLAKGSYRVF